MIFKGKNHAMDWNLNGKEWTYNVIDVSAGRGGLPMLIIGSERSALIDQGMSYCAKGMIKKIEDALGNRPLDFAIMTHSHYDHIGGIYALKKRWGNLRILAHEHCKKIMAKESAIIRMNALCEIARKMYDEKADKLSVEEMRGLEIDNTLDDGDLINLGDRTLRTIYTPGHTTCSVSFLLEPQNIIFPSETIGVLEGDGTILTAFDKSYIQTMESIERCQREDAEHIVSPHFGPVPDELAREYWDMARKSANKSKDFILNLYKEGKNTEEILAEYKRAFWIDGLDDQRQPLEAFLENASAMINVIGREFCEN